MTALLTVRMVRDMVARFDEDPTPHNLEPFVRHAVDIARLLLDLAGSNSVI